MEVLITGKECSMLVSRLEDTLISGIAKWKNSLFSETPATSPHLVWFKDESYHQLEPGNLEINWDPFNLTMNMDAKVEISLWGYRETTIEPELIYIASLESNVANRGKVSSKNHLGM